LEIYAQNQFRAPDAILVPVGDGVILSGVYKAFYDLKEAGLLTKLPRLICVQAENSAAIHHYIRTGVYQPAEYPSTIADSISVSVPSNAHFARKAVLESGGFSLTVTDDEILRGQRILAKKTGMFAEPAAAATVAALKKLKDKAQIDAKAQIVLLITGHGLKDIEAAMKNIKIPASIEPTVSGLAATGVRTARPQILTDRKNRGRAVPAPMSGKTAK
jgi:threonine synthase